MINDKKMTNVQSKLLPISATCKEYVHPWTDSCWNSTAGLLIQASSHSLRIYTAVYFLSLVMRGRVPQPRDIKRMILGIIQSSAFLTTNGFTFVMFSCLLRNLIGKFYFLTVAFVPSFLASVAAIFIERPSRRPLLALYVANVATESVWKLLASRGYVKSIAHGQAIIFGISSSILLYFYRLGCHRIYKDSLFDILRFVVGRNEEMISASRDEHQQPDEYDQQQQQQEAIVEEQQNLDFNNRQNDENNTPRIMPQPAAGGPQNSGPNSRSSSRLGRNSNNNSNFYYHISMAVRMYSRLIKYLKLQKRHPSCPHNNSCLYYSLRGGLKLFLVGFGLQITLKLVLQMRKIIQLRVKLRKTILNRDTLKLGLFLGGFSFLYKSVSCLLRHFTDYDHPIHAIPAGLIASVAFSQYPDTTVALYIMWKMLQIAYNIGIKKDIVPEVPGFTIILYCLSTAILFHAGIVEPLNLRPSYWKFLHSLSGGRVSIMDRKSFDVWGLNSSDQVQEVIKMTNTFVKSVKFPFA